MFKHILKKTLIAIATIWLIITISFTLVHTMPGDPIIFLIGEEEYYYLLDNNPAYLEQVTEKFGLNDDLPTQYARYMKSVLTLDFGLSYTNQKSVIENFRSAAYWTLLLSVPTLIISCILGAVLGIHAGIRPGGLFDRIAHAVFPVSEYHSFKLPESAAAHRVRLQAQVGADQRHGFARSFRRGADGEHRPAHDSAAVHFDSVPHVG